MGAPAGNAERATGRERSQLVETFIELCETRSPSGRERAVASLVRSSLEDLGLAVDEDQSAAETGADCGNLLTRLAGPPGTRSIMLCAHIDTVPTTDTVEVELIDGHFVNSRKTILGADNKAAVAVLIQIARRHANEPPPVGLELLFTTSEEVGLRGAKAFDVARLESEFGYAFDHASPIGELILGAPTYYRVTGDFRGRSAHAGIRPEDGRSAVAAAALAVSRLELGRIDERTTANVGRIEGGTATNVVAESCLVDAEVRSLDDAVAGERAQRMVDTFGWAASELDVDVDAAVEAQFRAYGLSESDPVVRAAVAALRDCGVEPKFKTTGGGSDANAFAAKGYACLNVANGTEANHTPDERVSQSALEQMLDVTLRLLPRAAEI